MSQNGVDNIRDVIRARLIRLHAGLTAIPGVQVFEENAGEPAFLTLTTEAFAPTELRDYLASSNIAIAVVDQDYARADFEARGFKAINRVAPHAYTSVEWGFRSSDRAATDRITAIRAR